MSTQIYIPDAPPAPCRKCNKMLYNNSPCCMICQEKICYECFIIDIEQPFPYTCETCLNNIIMSR